MNGTLTSFIITTTSASEIKDTESILQTLQTSRTGDLLLDAVHDIPRTGEF